MSIRRRKKTKPFTQIDNAALRNPDLSLKAKGLLAVMMSCPEDWQFYMSWLEKQSKDGKESHQSAMKELEQYGYVQRERANGEGGRLTWDYCVDDEPQGKSYSTLERKALHDELPAMAGFPLNGLTVNGESSTTNTDDTKNDSEKDLKREAPAAPTRSKMTQKSLKRTPQSLIIQDRGQISTRQSTRAVAKENFFDMSVGETERFVRQTLGDSFVSRLLKEVQPQGVDRRDWFTLTLIRVNELSAEATQTHDAYGIKVVTRFRDLLDKECCRLQSTRPPIPPSPGSPARPSDEGCEEFPVDLQLKTKHGQLLTVKKVEYGQVIFEGSAPPATLGEARQMQRLGLAS